MQKAYIVAAAAPNLKKYPMVRIALVRFFGRSKAIKKKRSKLLSEMIFQASMAPTPFLMLATFSSAAVSPAMMFSFISPVRIESAVGRIFPGLMI